MPVEAVAADDDDPGDQAEFRAFFERHHRELSRFAYLLSGDHDAADDITADALTAAWTRWDRVRAAELPLAYVRRIVANLAADRVRRAVRERRGLLALGEQAEGYTPEPDVPAVVDLRSALMSLPPGKRACVVLRYAFDLSEAETARTLGVSVGTVKSQTARGVADLERLLRGSPVGPAPSPGLEIRSADAPSRASGRGSAPRGSGDHVPPRAGGGRGGSLRPGRRRPGSSGSHSGSGSGPSACADDRGDLMPDRHAGPARPVRLEPVSHSAPHLPARSGAATRTNDPPPNGQHLLRVDLPDKDDHPTERIRRRLRPEARNWPGWRVGEA
ncbi:SigE family RNA polymerase sigma factor [Candidatus Frankia nodulisporulans]|uniref:SigE family RNA polymerase sigma factor n=1 Tax=Candidatus Frankia nodulisporulans TaxID=2060052 RepID=UPI0037037A6D